MITQDQGQQKQLEARALDGVMGEVLISTLRELALLRVRCALLEAALKDATQKTTAPNGAQDLMQSR